MWWTWGLFTKRKKLYAKPRQTFDERRLPFEVKAPNTKTRRAIAELEAGKGEKYNSVADMMAALDADD